MKKFSFVFIVFLNLWVASVSAQAPDLSKFKNDKAKIKAWLDYCADLRLNQSGAKDNYILLQQAGMKGLQMIKPNDDSDRAEFYLYTALGNYYQLKFDSAQSNFYAGMHSAQKVNYTRLIAATNEALMSLNFQLQQFDKVETSKNILETIADTTKDPKILQDIYAAFGSYYQQKSYYSTAQDYYIRSIQLREITVDTSHDLKVKFDYAIQCDQLSKLYLNTQMADKSLNALRKGERFASVSPVVSNRLLSSFVEAFTTLGVIDSALYYNNQLAIQAQNHPEFGSEIVSSNLNIGIYYIDHKLYDKALPYINRGDSLAEAIRSPFLIFQAQMIKGRYLEEIGKFDEAIVLLDKALPVSVQLSKELYSNILKYLALCYNGKGNKTDALKYYEQYVGIQDTLNKEKVSRTFADLETRYRTTEKQNEIISLDQKNKLNLLELKQAADTKKLLILGLLSLGIFSLLLYFIYRNREKTNRLLNERNLQLDQLNNELSIANETKAKLFGVIGHDLRAPVSKIVQMLHLQKESGGQEGNEKGEEFSSRINKASENVLETMEDLLLWSKSQMKNFTPQFRMVNGPQLIRQEIDLFKEEINDKKLALDLKMGDGVNYRTDENFLAVIVRNLLQNAIKNSEVGKVIRVELLKDKILISNECENAEVGKLNLLLDQTNVSSQYSGFGLQMSKDLANQIGIKIQFIQNDIHGVSAVIEWEREISL
ncbi:MAG: hypothetical protein ACMG51_00025 [Ginsengibacter sp.]